MWDTGWENTGELLIRRTKAQDCSSFFEAKLTVRKPFVGALWVKLVTIEGRN